MDIERNETMLVSESKDSREKCKTILNKLDIYKTFQIFWLIEVYYLMANSMINIIEFVRNGDFITSSMPKIVIEYNTLILKYFKEWSIFLAYIAVVLFISGIILKYLKVIPIISKYKIIIENCDWGIYSGLWLTLIYCTYEIFSTSCLMFCVIVPILAMYFKFMQWIALKLKDKLN